MFFTFPEDARWNAERQAVEFGVKIGEFGVCKDYGLDHIQYSVFSGPLDATRRKEMFARLDRTLGNHEGRILMLQLCEKDVVAKREIVRIPNPQ